ncbi:MAG: hypothetical protein ACK4F6_13730 [Hylemonella sp.]
MLITAPVPMVTQVVAGWQTSPQVLQLSFVPSRVQTPLQQASPLAHRLPQLPQFWMVLSEMQVLPLQQLDT